ncbi:Dihydrolipoyl dehydrogenase [Buchnera aphidicola (Tetraneura ulmi)]|uniref:dihydrolipoyl dehydrogenase n=1 Tax=Buchnera aphidicola TaxID=9 RepID=UPI00346413CB
MYKKIDTEVVVIGSGPAGYSAAFRCADLGLKTILVERYSSLGGVCLNVGCIPSKSLLEVSKIISKTKTAKEKGIFFEKPKIDLSNVNEWKNSIVNRLSNGLSNLAKKRKIQVIQGKAFFTSKNSIEIKGCNDNIIVKFSYSIIATGSRPIDLSILSFSNDSRIWNSTNALNITKIPSRLLIVGAGAIGLEMATLYSSFGSSVDVVDTSNELFSFLDSDIVSVFENRIQNKFNIFLETSILEVNFESHGIKILFLNKNSSSKNYKAYDAILVAIGRKPNSEKLNLREIGIEVDKIGFIKVNNQMQTTISNIFSVGDVTGYPMLAHKGMHQAHIAAEVISGKSHFFDTKIIPSIIYTDPEIGWVGLSEKEALSFGIDCRSVVLPWNILGKAILQDSEFGKTKLIFDKKTNKIIGGIVVGVNAGELLGEIGLSIEMGCDSEDISLTIHSHPTIYESIGLSAQMFNGTITDLFVSNKK